MELFPLTQKILWVLGFIFKDKDSIWYRWYGVFRNFVNLSLCIPVSAFLAQNKSDLVIVAETISISGTGQWNGLTKGLILFWNRHKIKKLIVDLQENCDRKERQGREKQYFTMNTWITYWSRINYIGMTNVMVSLLLGPLIFVLYHHFAGDLEPDMYRQVFGMSFPFDDRRTPNFQIIYVVSFFVILSLGYTIVVCDGLFMGVCSQIIACQKDLQDMLREVAVDEFHYKDRKAGSNPNDDVTRRLIECIKFYNKISSFVKTIGEIASPMIFAQYFITVIEIGTLFFVVQAGKDIAFDRYVANVIVIIVVLSELFIFCYFGNEVSYQGLAIADAAYDSNWYRCSPMQRRFFLLTMARAQKANIFQGFKMVNCSLSSYTSALNMIGSALALLKSSMS